MGKWTAACFSAGSK